jgi:hypothetical protein
VVVLGVAVALVHRKLAPMMRRPASPARVAEAPGRDAA